MPIISRLDEDRSDIACKLYAEQALEFLNKGHADAEAAGVPLSNLFRLFEMYRYDAFDDERRSGVLALAEFGKPDPRRPEPWHVRIKEALDKAIVAAFGNGPRDVAVEELQGVLRKLAKAEEMAQTADLNKHKAFYKEFSAALPA